MSGTRGARRARSARRRIVVALGGNAIQRAHDHGTWAEAVRQVRKTAEALATIVARGHELVLTHGNGPQVGSLLREAELGAAEVPVPPMHVLDAETQGQLGYLIAGEMDSALRRAGVPRVVLPIISRMEVSPRDPAFRRPSKPVGRFYPANEARRRQAEAGWTMAEDRARGGWRRLVPSPRPRRWLEGPAVRAILDAGLGSRCLFVVAGGGGIPVLRRQGRWLGVDAVIDKDRGAAIVAHALGAETLAIVTDVPGAALDFRSGRPQWLGRVTRRELSRYWRTGEFAEGSMGPKVEAGLTFLARRGRRFVITDLSSLSGALEGRAGTRVWPARPGQA